jgi:hypothetical protein
MKVADRAEGNADRAEGNADRVIQRELADRAEDIADRAFWALEMADRGWRGAIWLGKCRSGHWTPEKCRSASDGEFYGKPDRQAMRMSRLENNQPIGSSGKPDRQAMRIKQLENNKPIGSSGKPDRLAMRIRQLENNTPIGSSGKPDRLAMRIRQLENNKPIRVNGEPDRAVHLERWTKPDRLVGRMNWENNQPIGQTTAGADGKWALVTAALDDGVYAMAQEVRNPTGWVNRQTLSQALTIDGTVPDVAIAGPIDGVAWDSQISLAGTLRDLDPLTKVTYTVQSGGATVAAGEILGTNSSIANSVLTQKTLTSTPINLGAATGTDTYKPYEVALNFTDRAGNVSTQNYKGMRLNLPDLTEASILLPGTLISTLPADARTPNTSDPANQSRPTVGGSWLYIGSGTSGVGWGYYGGSGGPIWNPVANVSPALPSSVISPDSTVDYLTALRLALTTARDVLSNVAATASKREALNQQLEMLMAVGEVVKANNLYQAMAPMLQGVFTGAYGVGGIITKRQAILNGWQFAKDLAQSTTLTGLQIFQADLYAVSLAALKQNGVSGTSTTELKGAIDALATSYAKLRPFEEGYATSSSGAGWSYNNFLDNIYRDGRVAYGARQNSPTGAVGFGQEQQRVQEAISDLAVYLQQQVSPVKAFQFLDRTFQAATLVSQLRTDAYYQNVPVTANASLQYAFPSSIQDAGFLKSLTKFAFEVARSNPTVTAGANPTSEWIETLWEGGDLSSAAGGLANLMGGFQVAGVGNGAPPVYYGALGSSPLSKSRLQMGKALDYVGQLVQLSQIANVDQIVGTENAVFLSHLVNLGGAYAGLNPYKSTPTELGSFLQTLWQSSSIASVATKASQELLDTLGRSSTSINEKSQILNYRRNQFAMLRQVSDLQEIWHDPEFLAAVTISGYAAQINIKNSYAIDDFFGKAWRADSVQQLSSTVSGLRSFLAPFAGQSTVLDRDQALNKLLSLNTGTIGLNVGSTGTIPPTPNPDVLTWLPIDKNRPKVQSSGLKVGKSNEQKKALILAPFAVQFEKYLPYDLNEFKSYGGDEGNEIAQVLGDAGFEVTMKRNAEVGDNNIDLKKDILDDDFGRYSVIVMTSHGRLGARIQPQQPQPVVVSTGSKVTVKEVLSNGGAIVSGELDFVNRGGQQTFAITPEFIKKHMTNQGNNPLVYIGSCQSLGNDTLANAFLGAGASAFFGYTEDVATSFAAPHGLAMFNKLVTGQSTAQTPGIGDLDYYDPTMVKKAAFQFRGSTVSLV